MKVNQILTEMPYNHEGTMKRSFGMSYTSDTSLQRLYKPLLAEINADGIKVRFYVRIATDAIIGVIDGFKPDGEKTNELVFILKFKTNNTLIKKPAELIGKIMQVDKVAISKDFEGQGIASFIYATLVKEGNIILSDTSQFDDGKMLWKKMARKAGVSDYAVYILDDEYGFELGPDKKPLAYTSTNIDDAKIWSAGADVSKEHVLLVMKPK
jgi:hypothetical protein